MNINKGEKMETKTKAFDYIEYDSLAAEKQAYFKTSCVNLASSIESLPNGRAKSLALTKLEECYMWIGKAIRDEQLVRNANSFLQESRVNS